MQDEAEDMQARRAAIEEPVLAQTTLTTMLGMLAENQPEVVLAPQTTSYASNVNTSTLAQLAPDCISV
jgi:hypothetical protein